MRAARYRKAFMERKFVKGVDVKQQMDSIESTLQSFNRRLGKKVVSLMPPIPLLHSCLVPDTHGNIFAGVIPLEGTITAVCFNIGHYKNKSATIEASITRRDGTTYTKGLECKRRNQIFATSIPIEVGDVLRVREVEQDSVEEILLGILIYPTMDIMHKESQMIAQLRALEESEQ